MDANRVVLSSGVTFVPTITFNTCHNHGPFLLCMTLICPSKVPRVNWVECFLRYGCFAESKSKYPKLAESIEIVLNNTQKIKQSFAIVSNSTQYLGRV